MKPVIPSASLPGGGLSRKFEGENYDVGLSFFLVDAQPGKGPRFRDRMARVMPGARR